MTKKGREFNEIYDLTAMRVLVDSVKDCYGAIGVIHSLWKPLPGPLQGLGRDAQVQHVPGPPHDGDRARGPAARDPDPHARDAPHRRVRRRGALDLQGGRRQARPRQKVEWLEHLLDWQQEPKDPQEFAETLKADLFEDEVFVFTPKGEVKSLAAGATPLDFAYSIHTDVGHRCVGAKVNGKIVPLHYELQSGDICEVLTSKKERGPSRDWLSLAKTTRAQSKIRAWFKRERREDSERSGREILHENLKRAGLPPQKIAGSPLLADVIREMGFKKGEDFYIALGQSKISAEDRHQQADAPAQGGRGRVEPRVRRGRAARAARDAQEDRRPRPAYGIKVEGVDDVMLRLAKCCRPVPGRPDRRLHLARQGHHDPPRDLPERPGADEEPRALHQGGVGGRHRRPRSGSSSRSTAGTATACSRTCRARSPRPASTSSRRAARSCTRW